ncbi:ABC transporter [Salinisphaera orenii MK-B5]|uniref:ABC transporter n=1 Tax=Salinisphaera orenii MK-B5 TaxID=856730 RepID=A0A423PFY9_9GAMM|nr:ABC transporter ATP-binding protein [Salinisphaera orenii]ROO24504.1 ABC transporter [Salinisphaera orenii MK-B5]
MAALDIHGLRKAFGGNVIIPDVTLALEPGLITSLVGPNGAGKTTLFNLITGFLRPDAGSVHYKGSDLVGLSPQRVTRLGIARSFQDLRLFNEMTVFENVLVAQESSFRLWTRAAACRHTDAVLERVGLADKRDTRAMDLSYAERKFLNLARIMALDIDLFLLDEPASGLDGPSRTTFHTLLQSLKDEGHTVLLIEHNLDIVREVSDRIAFLNKGEVMAFDTPERIFANERLTDLYFGTAGRPAEAASC